MAATWVTIYFRVIRPRAIEHKKHEAERDQKRRDTDAFLFGVRPIEGVQEETLSAPRRLRAVELSVAAVVSSNQKVVAGQTALEQRMDEANGTTKRIESKVDELIAAGVATKKDLEETAVQLAEATRLRQEEVIETVKTEVGSIGHS
jgi:hypothetical protein